MPAIKPRRYLTTVTKVEPGRVVVLVDAVNDESPRSFTLSAALAGSSLAVGDRVELRIRELADGTLQAQVQPIARRPFQLRGWQKWR